MAANAFRALSLRRSLGFSRIVGNPKPPITPRRNFSYLLICNSQPNSEQLLVVIGGGPAGVFGALRAKDVAPDLRVVVVEKGRLLSKVKISGGGRCNVTNGHYVDKRVLAEHYPRGHKELQGSFFDVHGPEDTISWFNEHNVHLKTEDDGRVFPLSDSSATIVDCLLNEARRSGVELETGKVVTTAYCGGSRRFTLNIEKLDIGAVETVEADYLLITTGSSRQGYAIATQLGHSIIQPVPSLFTFKIEDIRLRGLAGITFPKVKVRLKMPDVRNIPQFEQVGPMLVTHWGLSGPVILRLSAWGARDLLKSNYSGTLSVDFVPDYHIDDVKSALTQQKSLFAKQKVLNSCPTKFNLVRRFWQYLVEREGVDGDVLWGHMPGDALSSISLLMKQCAFTIVGKGQFKDEFVTAGGVPLKEISLTTMGSITHPGLFFAGEVLNVDGVTGGFNFQNAWTGGYIAGTSIGRLASTIQHD